MLEEAILKKCKEAYLNKVNSTADDMKRYAIYNGLPYEKNIENHLKHHNFLMDSYENNQLQLVDVYKFEIKLLKSVYKWRVNGRNYTYNNQIRNLQAQLKRIKIIDKIIN